MEASPRFKSLWRFLAAGLIFLLLFVLAAKLLVSSPVREIDLLEVNGKLYMCLVVLGFYPSQVMGQEKYHGSWIVKSIRTLWQSVKSAATFPPLNLFTVEEIVGSWTNAQKVHFADGGIFDQIYTKH